MHDDTIGTRAGSTSQDSGPSESTFDIDVVIAVHTTTRPLRRAIQSCQVHGPNPTVRVTVVCHNIAASDIARGVGPVEGVNVRYLQFDDGTSSPAGPKNMGLDSATARYVCVLDSDDYLEVGALSAWHQRIVGENADGVIAPVRHEAGPMIKTPRARPGRESKLDPVKDGLAYATALRGLWKAGSDGAANFRYGLGLRTGEDLAPGLEVYFSGANLLYPRTGPAYVLGDGADDRVTGDLLPLAEEFRAILSLPHPWLDNLPYRQRLSIAAKIARTGVVSAILRRGEGHDWSAEELAAVQDAAIFLDAMAPGYSRVLTASDGKLLESCLRATSSRDAFHLAVRAHEQTSLPSKVFASNFWGNFCRDSQLRQIIRATMDRRA